MPPEDVQPEEASPLRSLPSVDRLLDELGDAPHPLRLAAAREAIEEARASVLGGDPVPPFEEILSSARRRLESQRRATLLPVLNGTGVLLHTNLGRAPLGTEQLARVSQVASGYSNLEYDLDTGVRGDRYSHAARTLTQLTGAEAALVVNNNAAAVFLVLSTLCEGREVILSRGELVEIGGEFRIPEVMAASKARLVEVGTTNRTHLGDFERAIGPETVALLKVHASNFKVVGFTASVARTEMARLARGRGLMFIEDLGSGLLDFDEALDWARGEPPVRSSLEAGVDVVTFSGDKLLGGPQAGIIVGRREAIGRIKKNPLLRALRVDKMTLAALQATLDAYLADRWRELPFWRMSLAPGAAIESRARKLLDGLSDLAASGVKLEVAPSASVPGGGSLPGQTIPSWALSIEDPEVGADALHERLRKGSPPLIARREEDRLLVDLRTIEAEDDALLLRCLRDALIR